MTKAFNLFLWENEPSVNTPLGETLLNKVNIGLEEIDNRVINMDVTKANQTDLLTAVADVTFDEDTGIFTIIKKSGATTVIDTKLEKLAINFTYDADNQRLVLTLEDGTIQYVDLKELVTELDFLNSNTVIFSVSQGKVTANIAKGSITSDMLEPNYLANIQLYASQALSSANSAKDYASNSASSATLAESYTHGNTGARDGEDTDNAKYYMEQAKNIAGSDISNIIDGTTPVGNALALGGKDASEYALDADLANYLPKSGGEINGTTALKSYDATNIAMNVANSLRSIGMRVYSNGVADFFDYTNNKNIFRSMADGANTFNGVASECLPKSGGDITGNINQNITTADYIKRNFSNSARKLIEQIAPNGVYQLYDNTNGKAIILSYADGTTTFNGTASGNLPISGGTVNGNVSVKALLEVFNTYSNLVHIRAKNNSHSISMHVSDAGNAGLYDDTHSKWLLKSDSNGNLTIDGSNTPLHTGNMPKGKYTGNGSATSRTVNVGGVGHCLIIWADSGNSSVIVTPEGNFGHQGTTFFSIPKTQCVFYNGVLTIATSSAVLNYSGGIYHYKVL